MKSLDVVPIRRARTRTVFEFEDEITSEVFFLGGLVNAPPCVVEEDASIDVVRDHLLEKRISAVVVIDAQRSLRGLVTRTDVLRAEPGARARDAMSPYIFALPAISRIERAAALMAFEDVAHVVVTDSASELVGLVSAVDIARHYAVQTGFLAGYRFVLFPHTRSATSGGILTDVTADPEIRVVYVEDDERLARLTTQYLQTHRIEVNLVNRGDLAVSEVLRVRPDVVLLDLMLPGVDGIDVCRQLRQRSDVPIIMVTARGEEADRVVGLEGGADDYVTKPFQSRELLARIRAQARRGRGESGPRAERLEIGALVIDASTMEVIVRGQSVALTTNEFALVHALAQRAGRVLGREQLLQLLHGSSDEAFDRSIDVVVSRVRQKLEEDPRNPRMLKTIRGVGYMLTPGER